MGRRGPAPTPSATLKLRGSSLYTRKREKREVRGPEGCPDRPDWLEPEAVAAWDYLVPMLEGMGVLTRVDGHALARYCRTWARWRKAEQFIDQHTEMYPLKDDAGNVKCFAQWPQVAVAHKLAQQLTRLEQEFGMTPSSRSRMQAVITESQGLEKPNGKSRFFEAG